MEMERKVVVTCTMVGFLGLLSAVLGFAAEAKRIKASQVTEVAPGICSYPRSPAYALGITAAVSLLIAKVITDFASGCCCRSNSYTSSARWTLALICSVISWFTFIMAFILLLGGAALNDEHGGENLYLSNYYCYVVKPGVFVVAAVSSFVSVTFGILYYLTTSPGKKVNDTSRQATGSSDGSIAMGHHQVTRTSQDPVFVHEDTYMRRQMA